MVPSTGKREKEDLVCEAGRGIKAEELPGLDAGAVRERGGWQGFRSGIKSDRESKGVGSAVDMGEKESDLNECMHLPSLRETLWCVPH